MPIPQNIQAIIDHELRQNSNDGPFDLDPRQRLALYRAFGPSCVPSREARFARVDATWLPHLTPADRVRAQLAKLTAQKVLPLWSQACQETLANFAARTGTEAADDDAEVDVLDERSYLQQRQELPIEHISVYRVPQPFIPQHIMEMGDLALGGRIFDYPRFAEQANEWWEIYPRPEWMEREYSIKWATQDYLYETLGRNTYMYQPTETILVDEENEVINHLYAPAGYALVAYARVFSEAEPHFDSIRQREFWQWWLTEAIPLAWQQEYS